MHEQQEKAPGAEVPSHGSHGLGGGARPVLVRRTERLHEGLVELIDIGEILAAVALSLAEDPVLDQTEDDLSKIRTPMHAPGFEHGLGERTELIERVNAQPLE